MKTTIKLRVNSNLVKVQVSFIRKFNLEWCLLFTRFSYDNLKNKNQLKHIIKIQYLLLLYNTPLLQPLTVEKEKLINNSRGLPCHDVLIYIVFGYGKYSLLLFCILVKGFV